MKRLVLLTGIASLLFLTGCASKITKGEAFPAMYEEKPVSILVVPSINHSTAADAPDLYSSTINEPLSNAGFYVLPMEVTDRFLRNEGLAEGGQIKDIPPQKFAETFGADAVFYATIEKWDTTYYVIGGNVAVGIDFKLKSTKTGETIWNYKQELTVDTSEDAGHPLLSIAITAIKTAVQDYVPIARRVNLIALNGVPYGKYHKWHGQDREAELLEGNIKTNQ